MYNPSYYEFCCSVDIRAGHAVLETIPDTVKSLGGRKPMILSDKGVSAAGLVDLVVDAMEEGVRIGTVEDDVPADSDVRVVNRLAGVYREKGCDALIAIGGGSVMDTAKGINIVVTEGVDDIMEVAGAGAVNQRLKPLVAVPTTAGTGSEVTLAAVIADHSRNLKMPFTSTFLLPDVAILDSRMTLTLPGHITAATAMDAMTHAVESYYCLARNPISATHSLAAIRLISQNLTAVLRQPDDRDGRLALAVAAALAGAAFSNSMVGMVHGIGHSVGGVCGIPHGQCMAIGLPYGLEYNLHKIEGFVGELLLPLEGPKVYAATDPGDRPRKVIAAIRRMNQELHELTDGRHARCFKEIRSADGSQGVPAGSIEAIAETCLGDGSFIYNPEHLDYDDILKVVKAAWEGRPLDRSFIRRS
jgi:alcohol dehydrogenase